jgi:hypothetical protein
MGRSSPVYAEVWTVEQVAALLSLFQPLTSEQVPPWGVHH